MSRVGAVVANREILRHVIERDIRVKYGSSVIGYGWSLLEPLMLAAVYYFIFSIIARFNIENYPLFLISALLPWLWVRSTVTAATKAFTGQARLITKVAIPREIFPLAVVGAKGFEFVVSLAVILFFAAVSQVAPNANLGYFPLAFALQVVLLTGISLLLASINVMLRDLERIIGIVMRAMFYLSPVVYPLSRVLESDLPYWARSVYQLNPLVGILSLYRSAFFADQFPSTNSLIAATVGSLLFLAVGYWTFVRLEPKILKEL